MQYCFQISVVLYNTATSPEPEGDFKIENAPVVPHNCAILIPLKQIEAPIIRYVKNMKSSEDFMDFDNKFGHSTDAKISDLLWLCSTIFGSCERQIRVPTIMWYTDGDAPHKDGSADQRQALQKAKDLQQLHIDIQFFPLKVDFDGDLFYKELLCQLLDLDLDDYEFPTPQLNEKKLLQRMFRRGCNKRARSYLSVEFSENVKFGVGMYSYTRKTTMPKPILLSRSNQEVIVSKRSYKCGTFQEGNDGDVVNNSNLEADIDFKEKLQPSKAIKLQHCGGEKIKFTPLEAYEIKQVMDPKIKVLGFKPSSVLNEHNHIKCPLFLYPAENIVKNSTVFFRALWERCLADDSVVICIMTMRIKSYPRLVALVPQEQTMSDDGETLSYDGFRMEFIPFSGDIRDLSEVFTRPPEIDQNVTQVMKKIVGKLRINYSPALFDNPAITKIYSAIEQQVFDDDFDEELIKDPTLADLEVQDDRIAEFSGTLEQLLDGFEDIAIAPKRKGADATSETKRKKVSSDDINEDLVLQKCKEGRVKDLTVAILRGYLELKNISGISKLTKPLLVEKILALEKS